MKNLLLEASDIGDRSLTRAGAAVVALRLVVPLSILRWPLSAGLASAALDAADVVLVDWIAGRLRIRGGFGPRYAQIDKWLDSYYLGIEAIQSRTWPERRERRIASALAVHRFVGVAAFEAVGDRRLLFAFPNLFENFYWYVLANRLVRPGRTLRGRGEAAKLLALLLIPKLVQEWVLHVAEIHPWELTKGWARSARRSGRADR